MHGLHLIKFLDREPGSSQVVQQKPQTVRQHCNQTEKLVSQIFKPQVQAENESSKPTKKPSVQQYISQIFGRPNSDIPRSKISKRFNSFLFHKKKLSNDSLCADRRAIHIKNNKVKSKTKRKKKLPRGGSVTDKIEVLFKSKNWKSKRRRPLTLNSKDISKYAIHYNSKSSQDINYDKKNGKNNFCCRLHIPQVKRRRRSTTIPTASSDNARYHNFYSDHNIQHTKPNLNSTCQHHAHQLDGTYNVIDFPNAARFNPNDSSKLKQVPRLFHTQQIVVPTTSFENSKGGGDNAASLPVQGAMPTLLPKSRSKCRSKVLSKDKNFSRSSNVPTCPIFITKSVKFTLIALSVIIWFPCILMMSLLWIVSYPMRPHEIIKTVRDIESCKTEKCQNDDQEFWKSIYTCVAGAVKKLLGFYEAMFSLIKDRNVNRNRKRFGISQSSLLRRNENKQYPNPQKKYKLYYDKDRGWVMKPIKVRKDKNLEKAITHGDALSEADKLNKNRPTLDLMKCGNDVSNDKCPSKDSKVTKNEQELESQDLYAQSRQQSDLKEHQIQGISRNQPKENKVSDFVCDQKKKNVPQDVNCVCESVQTECKPLKSKNVPVYSSLQKTPKFVTFNDKIPPHSDSQCICTADWRPCQLRNCSSLKSTCVHNKRNVKMNEKKAPSLPAIHRRCLCNCKLHKPIECLNRKYSVPNKLNTKKRSRLRQSKARKKVIQQKTRPNRKNKFSQFCQKFRKKAAVIIREADGKVWNCDNCEDIFVQTLRKRPCAWIHRRWPKFYPYFLVFCKFYENLAYAMLYVCTACIWFTKEPTPL
ncbi:uncharacterized protein LOC110995208 [Pieris rapae]|uniref:uncharacterized protein LOC110995208 n=1 Tax=Pieris rapae TaxID=64459 RepID=UPI001E27D09E|nr:uncharacterized protein LOC110995208 [Pieris rapae]